MKPSQEQIKELSEWLDEAIDNMNTVHEVIGKPDGVLDAILLGHSVAAYNSLQGMRNYLTEYERHSRQHDKEETCH